MAEGRSRGGGTICIYIYIYIYIISPWLLKCTIQGHAFVARGGIFAILSLLFALSWCDGGINVKWNVATQTAINFFISDHLSNCSKSRHVHSNKLCICWSIPFSEPHFCSAKLDLDTHVPVSLLCNSAITLLLIPLPAIGCQTFRVKPSTVWALRVSLFQLVQRVGNVMNLGSQEDLTMPTSSCWDGRTICFVLSIFWTAPTSCCSVTIW